MRSFLICTVLLAASCTSKSPESDQPAIQSAELQEISFEGEVPFDSTQSLHLEVHLSPTGENAGRYAVKETIIESERPIDTRNFNGFYNLYRIGDKLMLVLENSIREIPLRRLHPMATKNIMEENFRNNDLQFIMQEERLQLLDGDAIVSDAPEHFLYQRTTPVFTVEGYFMYQGDTSTFYETNTNTRWPLTKLGCYYQAAREHNTLVDRKNDTTYLKATGYCISVSSQPSQKKINALVLQRILQSSTL